MAIEIRTAGQLLRAQDIGRCELVRGELRMMNPPGANHGRITIKLTVPITNHVDARGLGTIYAAETGFLLSRDPDTVRAPDIAFVSAGRPPAPPRGYYPGAPDLAVEVLSPDDRPAYVADKVAEWLESGAAAVWVVDPFERIVTVHEPDREPVAVGEHGTLRGGSVLPGFAIPVREIL
jgi:Uma2 family endonuclease